MIRLLIIFVMFVNDFKLILQEFNDFLSKCFVLLAFGILNGTIFHIESFSMKDIN